MKPFTTTPEKLFTKDSLPSVKLLPFLEEALVKFNPEVNTYICHVMENSKIDLFRKQVSEFQEYVMDYNEAAYASSGHALIAPRWFNRTGATGRVYQYFKVEWLKQAIAGIKAKHKLT
jgi:hypothetical protein